MRLVANFTSTSLIAILAMLLLTPTVIIASEVEVVSGGADPSEFLAPDGRFDLNAARQAGFEGSLNLEGFDVQFDPRTGEPLFSTAAAVNSPSDHPDDIYWDNSISPSVAGVDYYVNAATVYDGQLIVGGAFAVAGDVIANHIAAWDGSTWDSLGSGMNSSVLSLTVYNGDLIAGGFFRTAGGVAVNNIARWDGSAWDSLGSGTAGLVRSLTVYNGELIAGGEFWTAGGVAANYISRWDGSTWQPLGSGMNNDVLSLTVYNGELVAGGDFTTAGGKVAAYIARWDKPATDTDSDGVPDYLDNCPTTHNPGQEDADTDGVGDVCDECTDTDGDGYGNPGYPANTCEDDNCPDSSNADQADLDGDGAGDVCDPDDDNDGVLDGSDTDPSDPTICEDTDSDGCDDCSVGTDGFGPLPDNDPTNDGTDTDSDGLCDSGDECTDTDGDGYGNPGYAANTCPDDNCPDDPNTDQADGDGDTVGDVCDNCPFTPNPDQTDSDSDNVGDACQGAYVEPGDSVTVNLTDSLSITFDSVITGGVTEVNTSSGGPPPPEGFRLVPSSPPIYYEISTSAEYLPPVTICFTYDENEIHVPEHKLRIFHREGDPAVWLDVTVAVDTDANVICGVVSSLSPFVLAVPYCCFLRGDVDHSGVAPVDIADLVYLVDYMFNQGPEPECFEEGDVDGSGVMPIDIADLVYLVDYMFNSGPEPPPCP